MRMTTENKPARRRAARRPVDVDTALAWLERKGTKKVRDGMARYAIPSDSAFGVSVGDLRAYAKTLVRDHDLAAALWATGRYEARFLAAFLEEPALVTRGQMDRWARDFDSWAICDHCCMHIFDRTPHALAKIEQWGRRRAEFVKRAGFALIATTALHRKELDDAVFLDLLPQIENGASDARNFVKKGVLWALRGIGQRSAASRAAAMDCARSLALREDATARWIGKTALREMSK